MEPNIKLAECLELCAKIAREGLEFEIKDPQKDWKPCDSVIYFLEAYNPSHTEIRIKPEPELVPLGPEDVPPGSVFRWIDQKHSFTAPWYVLNYVLKSDICLTTEHGSTHPAWDTLKERWEINRSIPLNGRWDEEDWKPCHKEA